MADAAAPPSQTGALPLLDAAVLRSFVAIAESGSFSRAAERVHRTPAALSMQIKRLEEILESTLFVRDARQVRLTPAGETLLSYGRRLLKLNEEAVSHFLAPALEGTVRIGTPDDVGTRILPRLLTHFARAYPAVQVDVIGGRSRDLLGRLDAGELDLALVTLGNTDIDSARREIVHTEPLVWAGRDGGVASQCLPLPISLASHGCAWRAMALTALDAAGIPYRIAYTSDHCAGQEAALLADLAVAPFPTSLVRAPLQALGPEHGLPPLGEYHIGLIRRPSLSRVGEVLAQEVVGSFRELTQRRD